MPIFAATLIGFLAAAAGNLAGRVLLALGFGFVAYTGIDLALGGLMTTLEGAIAGLPSIVVEVLGVCNVDRAAKMIMSAIGVKMVLNGLESGVMKRMVVK